MVRVIVPQRQSFNSKAQHLSSRPLRVVLLSPPGDLGLIVLRSLSALGAETLLICQPRSAIRFSSHVSQILLANDEAFENTNLVVDVINAEAERAPIGAVLASSVAGLKMAARAQPRLNVPVFPMPTLSVLEVLNDKWRFAQLCTECSVPTPKTLLYPSASHVSIENVRREIGYPCVVKPVNASGGDGICVVSKQSDLHRALADAAPYSGDGLLVQRFMSGADVGLSVFAESGQIRNWATFYCDGHWSTQFAPIPELLEAGRRIVSRTRLTGVVNFDARYDKSTGSLALLECNPRFFRRVSAARNCGLDFVSAGLASLDLADEQPTSITKGRHLSAQDLFSRVGLRMIMTQGYSLGQVRRDTIEFLADPAPIVGALLNELWRSKFKEPFTRWKAQEAR
jgi:predicted ATP-grasp superfamily ATP-dependent carboligase